jgi:cell wall-active antibiotic response 4TMS protein YvqF
MRIRPGLLFWGIFFLLLGGIPLLVRAGVLDPDLLADAWRLWPLLLVILGLALILGRTSAGLLGTALAAVVLGVAAGGALASTSNVIGNVGGCGPFGSDTDQRLQNEGSFEGPMTASFDLNCGSLDVVTRPGSDWSVDADYRGEPPMLDVADGTLDLKSPSGFGVRRQDWEVTLPADQAREVSIDSNASAVNARLAGAALTSFRLHINAGDARVDGSGGTLGEVDVSANAGRIRLRVDSDTRGSMSANAGSLELCTPPGATLRFRVSEQLTFAHNLDDQGLAHSGEVWTREGAVGAPVIDLSIEGNAANFTLDPVGGC